MAPAVATRTQDLTLIELVDALVEAIDIDRIDAVERLREALEPFGAAGLLNDEIRLNGSSSTNSERPCFCEMWL